MSKPKNNSDNVQKSRHPAAVILSNVLPILAIVGLCILAYCIAISSQEREEQEMADIEAKQIAESSHYTAVVTAVDMSNGTVTLDNGHIMPADDLAMTPNINDVLAYTKSYEYEIGKWDGKPKRTGQDAFLNVESIGQISK